MSPSIRIFFNKTTNFHKVQWVRPDHYHPTRFNLKVTLECWSVNGGDGGSIPPTTISKLRQFLSPHIACVFRKIETLKAGGPFYLVSMPGEVKDPTQWVNV